jgi:DNA-directed RNA polymerase subunit beta'
VQLDGGRFAASDLNDLYRRVINRNNRLKKLMGIGAPEVINRNEKRMLQESVDTLLNNSGRGGRALFTAGDRRKLRSLSDMLKGKQGRFRQNLLGKRVDYSGRSVIVVGPTLKLNQCGLPKKMAMKLFKPFVIGQLIQMEYAHNVKGAEKLITEGQKYVWDILEEVIHEKYVLLNRAPTLHRLGIQAFNPVLIDGKAIQLHPLVCAAYNADFDGDQMAVHLPLSDRAQREAKELMSSATNVLKPSAGEPVIDPTQDMVLGCYFITQVHDGKKGEGMNFGSSKEAILAFETGLVDVQAKVNVRMRDVQEEGMVETSIGRLMFNNIMPEGMEYINVVQRKKDLSKLVALSLDTVGTKETVLFADRIKDLGFKAATMSGISMAASDLVSSDQREGMIDASREIIKDIQDYYDQGIITEDERYTHAIKLWSKTKNEITAVTVDEFKKNPENDVYYIIDSAARGNWGQVTQLAGMKGLVANPSGKTIELPIQSNLKLGFSVLEYFIATHGGRKGKSDTALKTAEAGYLTRRLVDAVQDIIIREEDCGSKEVHWITQADSERIGEKLESRIFGRSLAEAIKVDGKTIAKRNEEIDANVIEKLMANDITEIPVRSMMTCKTRKGICIKCYGRDLGDNKTVEIGVPVGLIAAQSIGEPGTQLTMRTFHMGGVADGADITQGLTRVEELFEARNPKTPAVLSDISGKIKIGHKGDKRIVRVMSEELGTDIYAVPAGYEVVVKKGDLMKERGVIAKSTNDKSVLRATIAGTVEKAGHREIHIKHEENQVRSYEFTSRDSLIVKNNQEVEAGEALSMGHYNLQELLQKRGAYVAQNYVVQEVQHIYASQGQTINDKHLEIIVRKMFSKVRILNAGDTKLLPGEVVDIGEVEYQLEQVKLKNKDAEGATYEQILLGISRAALATDSWLAGASFQETVRVLVEAATTNSVDKLQGLKENVIIGRLIPTGEVYRKRFGGEEEKENAADAKTVDAKEETESEE